MKKISIFLIIVILFTSCAVSQSNSETSIQLSDNGKSNASSADNSSPTSTPLTGEEDLYSIYAIQGRGKSDDVRDEPIYVGLNGYLVLSIYDENDQKKGKTIPSSPWIITTYSDENLETVVDTVEHKTAIKVISQNLSHKGYGNYSGSLLVRSQETGEEFYVNVSNFMYVDYWNIENLVFAARGGNCIAEYNQVSNVLPRMKDNTIIEDIPSESLVLIIGSTGTGGQHAHQVLIQK